MQRVQSNVTTARSNACLLSARAARAAPPGRAREPRRPRGCRLPAAHAAVWLSRGVLSATCGTRRSTATAAHRVGGCYTAPMLKGSRDAILKKIQPISVHGQISLDVQYIYADEDGEQIRVARVGPEAVDKS